MYTPEFMKEAVNSITKMIPFFHAIVLTDIDSNDRDPNTLYISSDVTDPNHFFHFFFLEKETSTGFKGNLIQASLRDRKLSMPFMDYALANLMTVEPGDEADAQALTEAWRDYFVKFVKDFKTNTTEENRDAFWNDEDGNKKALDVEALILEIYNTAPHLIPVLHTLLHTNNEEFFHMALSVTEAMMTPTAMDDYYYSTITRDRYFDNADKVNARQFHLMLRIMKMGGMD
jgi:hypothetical protein